ncbi:hypothetical protein HDV00_012840 [Rhizophlyctis rosea]|nr:hypothetical protein HDV00_012840 [Rhizophlyctis rosea]
MDASSFVPTVTQLVSATAVAALSTVALVISKQRWRKDGEAPLLAGYVPYLGVAAEYGKDPAKFMNEARKKHGPVFTVYLAGKRMTFVLDPAAVPAFYRNKNLQFDEIEQNILETGFQCPKAMDFNHHLRAHYRFLHDPETLKGQSLKYQHILEGIFLRAGTTLNPAHIDGEGYITGKVWADASRWLFDANLATIFGDGFDADDIYKDFLIFDSKFPLAAAGMPDFMLKEARLAQRRQAEMMARRTLDGGKTLENASKFIQSRSETLKKHEASTLVAGRLEFTILWAAQANAMPGLFWSLAHILTHPDIRVKVEEEIAQAVSTNNENLSARLEINLQQLPFLDACISESLRLASSSLSLRVSKADQELDFKNGVKFRVRKGDIVGISSHHVHFDEDIYPEPMKYDPYRFYSADGKAAPRQLHLPFGGGTTLCPGRFLARNEIKTLIAMLLYALDVKVDSEAELPPMDQSRFGFGIIGPVGDLEFKYKLKDGVLAK